MSRFNNLRLAYRLGIAFGAMILALVVIGAIAVSKIGALNNDTKALTDHDMVTQQHVLNLQADVQRTAYLATSHLYVHDGELAVQDGVAKEITALTKSGEAEIAGLKTSVDEPDAKSEIARLEAAKNAFDADVATAVRRSRQETGQNVEGRNGSRGVSAAKVVPAVDAVTKVGNGLIRKCNAAVARSKASASATASSGRKTIVISALIAALVAVGLAFVVVTSVVRPLKVVVERLQMLRDVCITGLTDAIKAMATGDLTKTAVPKTPQVENAAGDGRREEHRRCEDAAEREPRRRRGRRRRPRLQRHPGQDGRVDRGLQRDARGARLARRQRVELGADAVGRLAADGDHLRGGRSRRRRDRLGRGRGRPGRRAPGARGGAGEARDRGGRDGEHGRRDEREGDR